MLDIIVTCNSCVVGTEEVSNMNLFQIILLQIIVDDSWVVNGLYNFESFINSKCNSTITASFTYI